VSSIPVATGERVTPVLEFPSRDGVPQVPLLVGAEYNVARLTWSPAKVERPRSVTQWLDSEAA